MSIYSAISPDQTGNPFVNFTQLRLGRVLSIFPRTGSVKVELLNSSYQLDSVHHSDELGEIHALVTTEYNGWDGNKNDKLGKGNWYGTKKQWRYGRIRFPRKGDYVIVGFIDGIALYPIVLATLPFLPTVQYSDTGKWWLKKSKGKSSRYSILDNPPDIKKYEEEGGESYDKWLDVHPSQVYSKLDWQAQSTNNSFQYEWSHPFGKESQDRIYDGTKFIISSGDDSESPIQETEKELLTERFRWEDYEPNRHPDPVFFKFTHVNKTKPPWIKLKAIIKKTTEFFISRINSIINDYIFFQVSGNKNELTIERKNADGRHKVRIVISGDSSNVTIYRWNGSKYHKFVMKDNEYHLEHENLQYVRMVDKDIRLNAKPAGGNVYLEGVNVFVEASNVFSTSSTPHTIVTNNFSTPNDHTTDGATYL